MKKQYIFILFGCFFLACQSPTDPPQEPNQTNPPSASPAPSSSSDAAALKIADQVMEAMGGQENWDNTRFITWSFFGRRQHIWDKQTGDVRIESAVDSITYLVNVKNMTGKVQRGNQEITHPDSLSKYIKQANSIWINDSYWLVMPFKLKDPGVTLKYLGEDYNKDKKMGHVLELTFEEVGDTPQNKYHVHVDKETNLVSEWSFFAHFSDAEPRFTMPWQDYKPYGNILLSGDRGNAHIYAIAVYENLPGKRFTDFEK